MEKKISRDPDISETIVNNYFNVKLVEAQQSGEQKYLEFIEASIKLWTHHRSLHVRLCSDIQVWHRTTQSLYRLIENETDEPRRNPVPLFHRPRHAPDAVWWAYCATTALLGISTTITAVTGSPCAALLSAITTAAWFGTVHQLYIDRKDRS